MASRTAEDGFHEIQLNGKQLVFLFMAATVVSVVIFLCGVLVGRGVRTERTAAQVAALSEAPNPEILPSAPASTPQAIQAGADPRSAAPPAPVDDLSYSNRVEKSSGVSEADIRPDSAKAADAAKASDEPRTAEKAPASIAKAEKPDTIEKTGKVEKSVGAEKAPPVPKPMPEPVAAAPKEPAAASAPLPSPTPAAAAGDGYAVQVAAVNARGDADAIAKRFSSKGYTAYVEVPPNGTGTVFRVRIGTFKTKREAETIAAKLQKEEQIKPWVTR
jgi:DedD protein